MSRITSALKRAEQESIPLRRKAKISSLLEKILPRLPRPFCLGILYREKDPLYQRFIGHLAKELSEKFKLSLITMTPEIYTEFDLDCRCCEDGVPPENCLIFDNQESEKTKILFLVNTPDFFVFHNLPSEKITGAVLIR